MKMEVREEEIKMVDRGRINPRSIATAYEFYLSGEVLSAENYIEWFNVMRHAGENDVIKIYINSFGGDLFASIQFMRVMADTQATVVVSVEGMCMSAATTIFLCADGYEVTPHSMFMFHNYSGGTFGKGGEMIDQMIHERKWSENLLNEIYKDFLTPAEIKAMLDGKDFWMGGEEVVKRLKAREEKRNSTSKSKTKAAPEAPAKRATRTPKKKTVE